MKTIAIISVVLGGFLLYLLSNANPTTATSAEYYALLLALNIAFGIFLLLLIVFQGWGLYRKVQKNVVGVKLNLRLLTSFALMALLPGLIVYLVSVNFITKSIESWFNVKVEAALEGGLNLGQTAVDILLVGVQSNAEMMAQSLSLQPAAFHYSFLNELRESSGIQEATLLTPEGGIIAVSSAAPTGFLPSLPDASFLSDAQYRMMARVEPIENKGLYLRVLTPVNAQQITGDKRILQLLQPVPKPLANTAESVQSVYQDYQSLAFNRKTLGDVFALSLTLVMMFATLVAVAIAFVLSRHMAKPLTVLSEGTKAIASGDYNIQLPEHSKDELGVLVKSFNSMTRQLSEATKAAELNRAKVEQARGYLQTVLAHLSSGVVALNQDGTLRTFNQAAIKILNVDLGQYIGRPLEEVALVEQRLMVFFNVLRNKKIKSVDNQDAKQLQIEVLGEKGKQLLTLSGTHLPDGSYVAVFDDATTMVQAQRDAAWGEVARRLAHEIRNPLTPIQLSAERIGHKLSDKLEQKDASMLTRAVKTIVNQVDAMKKMVSEFSEYARSPAPKRLPLNLNGLISEVVALYESNEEYAMAKMTFKPSEQATRILADSTMLRQVLHNLIQNALDACQKTSPELMIKTEVSEKNVTLTLQDNGTGFSSELLLRAFEPYMTSKTHGTGLGLAIVKKIIDEHDASIKIKNVTNQESEILGAMVQITFPAVSAS